MSFTVSAIHQEKERKEKEREKKKLVKWFVREAKGSPEQNIYCNALTALANSEEKTILCDLV